MHIRKTDLINNSGGSGWGERRRGQDSVNWCIVIKPVSCHQREQEQLKSAEAGWLHRHGHNIPHQSSSHGGTRRQNPNMFSCYRDNMNFYSFSWLTYWSMYEYIHSIYQVSALPCPDITCTGNMTNSIIMAVQALLLISILQRHKQNKHTLWGYLLKEFTPK